VESRRVVHFWMLVGVGEKGWRSVAKVVVMYVFGEMRGESMIVMLLLDAEYLERRYLEKVLWRGRG
jgi:hypothetical protein